MIIAATVALAGAAGLVVPFLPIGDEWRWMLTTPADLQGASVNADIVSIDPSGLQVVPQGDRPMSVITPPLSLTSSAANTLAVEVFSTQITAEVRSPTPVRLLWQTQAAEAYRFTESQVVLSGTPSCVRFSLPDSPEKIHRLGIQFPAWQEPLVITKFELPRLAFAEKLGTFAEEAVRREPLANHSINFIRGPIMLGHGLNHWLVCALALALGGYTFTRVRAGHPPSRGVVVGLLLGAWLVADVQATANLCRNVADEVRRFRGRSRLEQIASSDGPDIAWAYQALLAHCPEGGVCAVLSDDTFTPWHRLRYLLGPQRIVRQEWNEATYMLVMGASQVHYDSNNRRLSLHRSESMIADLLDQKSERVFLLKRGSQ